MTNFLSSKIFSAALCSLIVVALWSCGGGESPCGCQGREKLHGGGEKAWKLTRAEELRLPGEELLGDTAPAECEADDALILSQDGAWRDRYGALPCKEGGLADAAGPAGEWRYDPDTGVLVLTDAENEAAEWEVEELTETRLTLRRETASRAVRRVYQPAS